jgi:hypothetical protein
MRGAGHQFPVYQPSPGFPPVLPGAGIGMFQSTPMMGIPAAALRMPPAAAVYPMQQPMYPLPMMQVCNNILPVSDMLTAEFFFST